jgi:hypothetical protein
MHLHCSPTTLHKAQAFVEEKMIKPAKLQGLPLRVAFLRFNNVLRKPGPMFNFRE